jgi:hypothetical protein
MRILFLLFAVWGGLAQATVAEDAISQAKHFVKNGWHSDAVRELEAATKDPTGRSSFEVHAMLSKVHYALGDARKAQQYATRAIELGTNPASIQELERFSRFLKENFGLLHLKPPYPGMKSTLIVESAFPILDPEIAQFYEAIRKQWTTKTALPLSIGFPVGTYNINGMTIEVKAGKEATLHMNMDTLGASGLSALQVSRIEFSLGPAMLASKRAANLRPSLDAQFSISQPIGPWILGAQFDYSFRSFSVEGEGIVADPFAYTAGLRFGREFLIGGPLAFRPSLGYRYGLLPGIPLACESSDPLDPFAGPYVCRSPENADGVPDVKVYAIGRVHLPFAELSVDYRHSGRTTAMGMGVKLILGQALGKIAQTATATVQASGEQIDYTTADNRFSGTNIRMLANFSFAF